MKLDRVNIPLNFGWLFDKYHLLELANQGVFDGELTESLELFATNRALEINYQTHGIDELFEYWESLGRPQSDVQSTDVERVLRSAVFNGFLQAFMEIAAAVLDEEGYELIEVGCWDDLDDLDDTALVTTSGQVVVLPEAWGYDGEEYTPTEPACEGEVAFEEIDATLRQLSPGVYHMLDGDNGGVKIVRRKLTVAKL